MDAHAKAKCCDHGASILSNTQWTWFRMVQQLKAREHPLVPKPQGGILDPFCHVHGPKEDQDELENMLEWLF